MVWAALGCWGSLALRHGELGRKTDFEGFRLRSAANRRGFQERLLHIILLSALRTNARALGRPEDPLRG